MADRRPSFNEGAPAAAAQEGSEIQIFTPAEDHISSDSTYNMHFKRWPIEYSGVAKRGSVRSKWTRRARSSSAGTKTRPRRNRDGLRVKLHHTRRSLGRPLSIPKLLLAKMLL